MVIFIFKTRITLRDKQGHFIIMVNSSRDRPSQVELVVKNMPAKAGDIRDKGLTPGSGRSPGGVNGTLLQYSCLKNPMDREAWWATVQRVAKS